MPIQMENNGSHERRWKDLLGDALEGVSPLLLEDVAGANVCRFSAMTVIRI